MFSSEVRCAIEPVRLELEKEKEYERQAFFKAQEDKVTKKGWVKLWFPKKHFGFTNWKGNY